MLDRLSRAFLVAGAVTLIWASSAHAQYTLQVEHAGAAQAAMSGGHYVLQSTAGEPAVRIIGNGAPFYLGSGFWFAVRNENVALPVELMEFDAVYRSDNVQLQWATASETHNAGFAVERKDIPNGTWTQIGFVEGAGTTSEPQRYRFSDTQLPYETEVAVYRLKQVDFDGAFDYSPPVEVEVAAPTRLTLHSTFPNPVRHQTTIRYEVPSDGRVQLAVYDLLGRRVATLVDENQPAGRREITFQARRVSSGVYFLRLRAKGRVVVRKITVIQ